MTGPSMRSDDAAGRSARRAARGSRAPGVHARLVERTAQRLRLVPVDEGGDLAFGGLGGGGLFGFDRLLDLGWFFDFGRFVGNGRGFFFHGGRRDEGRGRRRSRHGRGGRRGFGGGRGGQGDFAVI